MTDFQIEIDSRLKRIGENEAQITGLLKLLWNPDGGKDFESLRQDELDLRQKNIILRREIADLRAKLAR